MKIGSIEIGPKDWEALNKLLNSKIGFALLLGVMAIGALWLTVPRLEAISQNTYIAAQILQDTKRTTEANHDILLRMLERCDISEKPSRNQTASAGRQRLTN